MSILVGTSGFSYDDWKGHFYPAKIRKEDMLAYYARVFSVVEINSTYYRLPSALSMYQMTRKVPAGFEFTVKASSEMTHAERFQPEVFEQFRQVMEPLQAEGMLGCVLAQFPWGFRPGAASTAYLRAFRDELPEMPLVVEVRHRDWANDETLELFRSLDVGFCCVDEPRLDSLMPPMVATTSPIGYVRFHGRNREKWFKHERSLERYDYFYSREELQEWAPKIEAVAAATRKAYVFFNNHNEGKAGQNARLMAELLRIPLSLAPGAAQQELSLTD